MRASLVSTRTRDDETSSHGSGLTGDGYSKGSLQEDYPEARGLRRSHIHERLDLRAFISRRAGCSETEYEFNDDGGSEHGDRGQGHSTEMAHDFDEATTPGRIYKAVVRRQRY